MKSLLLNTCILCVLFFAMMIPSDLNAQKAGNDTSYYETFPNKLTGRIYLNQKFLKFTIPSSTAQPDIEYKANTKMNVGLGVTYHNFSVNVFYGFGFLNKDTAKGKTKGLDIQLHLYPKKWAIDVLALFPKGFYIAPKGYAAANEDKYYYRPDVQLKLLGISAYRYPNKEKFSYRAAINQNEWQKKSAGSFLYGGTIHYGTFEGDSALVPKSIESNFPQKGITNVNFMAIGFGGGYAFTLVAHRHFYFTLSTVANLDVTMTSSEGANFKNRKTSFGPTIIGKGAIGYNGPNWAVSLNSMASGLWTKGQASSKYYYLPVGAIRLAVSKKFDLKKGKH